MSKIKKYGFIINNIDFSVEVGATTEKQAIKIEILGERI